MTMPSTTNDDGDNHHDDNDDDDDDENKNTIKDEVKENEVDVNRPTERALVPQMCRTMQPIRINRFNSILYTQTHNRTHMLYHSLIRSFARSIVAN